MRGDAGAHGSGSEDGGAAQERGRIGHFESRSTLREGTRAEYLRAEGRVKAR
jgi:hypothetical protein